MICTQDEWGCKWFYHGQVSHLAALFDKGQLDNRGQWGDKGKVKEEEENRKGEFGKFVIRIQ